MCAVAGSEADATEMWARCSTCASGSDVLKSDDDAAPAGPLHEAAGTTTPYSIFWKLGEHRWEPPPYDVSEYGFDENGTMILDVFGEHPTWPDIKGHDLGADGKPCGGWPPRDEFPCMNYS